MSATQQELREAWKKCYREHVPSYYCMPANVLDDLAQVAFPPKTTKQPREKTLLGFVYKVENGVLYCRRETNTEWAVDRDNDFARVAHELFLWPDIEVVDAP